MRIEETEHTGVMTYDYKALKVISVLENLGQLTLKLDISYLFDAKELVIKQ